MRRMRQFEAAPPSYLKLEEGACEVQSARIGCVWACCLFAVRCACLGLGVWGFVGSVCVALLRSRRRMDFRTGLGSTGWSDQQVAPSGVDSPLVERLGAVAAWISRLFTGLSAWASVCVCVLWRRMDFRAVDACAHGCPWTLAWLRGACAVRAWLSCARSCCVCACGLMCVPGGPFFGAQATGVQRPRRLFSVPRPRL